MYKRQVHTSTDLEDWVDSGYTVVIDDASTLQVSIPANAAGRTFVQIVISSNP